MWWGIVLVCYGSTTPLLLPDKDSMHSMQRDSYLSLFYFGLGSRAGLTFGSKGTVPKVFDGNTATVELVETQTEVFDLLFGVNKCETISNCFLQVEICQYCVFSLFCCLQLVKNPNNWCSFKSVYYCVCAKCFFYQPSVTRHPQWQAEVSNLNKTPKTQHRFHEISLLVFRMRASAFELTVSDIDYALKTSHAC